jgi:serine/threonine protein kinase
VSQTARDFVSACLTVDPAKRLTAEQVLAHPWLHQEGQKHGGEVDLLPNVVKNGVAKKTRTRASSHPSVFWPLFRISMLISMIKSSTSPPLAVKGTVKGVIFAQRLKAASSASAASADDAETARIRQQLDSYKQEAEAVRPSFFTPGGALTLSSRLIRSSATLHPFSLAGGPGARFGLRSDGFWCMIWLSSLSLLVERARRLR